VSFNLITFEEFVAQANAEVRRVNPDIDPTVFGSFTVPYNTSASALAYSVQQTVVDLSVQLFPQTAEGEFLERWAGYEGLERLPASSATGLISIEGVAGTTIPALTVFQGSNGLDYESQAVSTVVDVSQVIQTLERSGSTITATMADDHQLASGIKAIIAGAVEADYNGTFTITVVARNKFTYTIATTPTTPATGTINYSATFASIELKAVDTGQQTNTSNGSVFTPTPAIVNVDPSGFAQFDGMSGGAEVETNDALRVRVLLSRSLIEGVFTPDQVKLAALSVAGNTRVFVIRPSLSVSQTGVAILQAVTSITRSGTTATVTFTGDHSIGDGQFVTIQGAVEVDYNGDFQATVTGSDTITYQVAGSPTSPATGTIEGLYCKFSAPSAGVVPTPGQVAVYVLRDNDANIIPTQTVLNTTKDAIIADGALPAHSAEIDVFVLGPETVETDFDFASITPDTPTMRSAVELQLEAFFEDTVDFEQTVTEAAYLGAIQNTQDLQTGDLLQSFSLTAPTGDIVVLGGQIATLGAVTFP